MSNSWRVFDIMASAEPPAQKARTVRKISESVNEDARRPASLLRESDKWDVPVCFSRPRVTLCETPSIQEYVIDEPSSPGTCHARRNRANAELCRQMKGSGGNADGMVCGVATLNCNRIAHARADELHARISCLRGSLIALQEVQSWPEGESCVFRGAWPSDGPSHVRRSQFRCR